MERQSRQAERGYALPEAVGAYPMHSEAAPENGVGMGVFECGNPATPGGVSSVALAAREEKEKRISTGSA